MAQKPFALEVDIHTPPGTKIRYAYPGAGDEGHKEYAALHLTLGQVYTVDATLVGFDTDLVVLAEVRGKVFSAMNFAKLDGTTATVERGVIGFAIKNDSYSTFVACRRPDDPEGGIRWSEEVGDAQVWQNRDDAAQVAAALVLADQGRCAVVAVRMLEQEGAEVDGD